jgi:hypothetical protein
MNRYYLHVLTILQFTYYFISLNWIYYWSINSSWGRRGRDGMVVKFTTTCVISAYHQQSCDFESHSWRGVLDTTLCDKVCQWLPAGRWLSQGTPVSATNNTDPHDIAEILLKVALNTINLSPNFNSSLICTRCFNAVYEWVDQQRADIILLSFSASIIEHKFINAYLSFQTTRTTATKHTLWKESLSSDGQQFHQYQLNE